MTFGTSNGLHRKTQFKNRLGWFTTRLEIYRVLPMTTNLVDSGKWAAASLRIFSDVLTADELTLRLGAVLCNRGQITATSLKGRSVSTWILKSNESLGDELGEHLREVVEVIEANLSLLSGLMPECRIDLFCAFASDTGQGGFVLNRSLLARLGRLPFDLIVDLYPPGDEDDPTP